MDVSMQKCVPSPIQDYLEQLHRQYADLEEGTVASYIPELAKADPRWFSLCLATTDGQVYEVGESRQGFTIQSISKPFVYGLALEDNGEAEVLKKVGVEPTGDAFNSISLDPQSGRPLNPMINAGAIATTGMLQGETAGEKLHRVLSVFARYVGHDVAIDHVVYQSEKSSGHRNRAIGHMLRNFDIITSDPEPVLDLYFQQCSISVNCRDLAVMAATLANGGVNPLTGQRAIKQTYVESILSVMASCGMYDYAGEWIYRVGMPAKSGVGGGILAVLPGQLGIGVFSPPLDVHGNSVRGLRVCHAISQEFNLHLFNIPRFSRSVIRSKYDATQMNSRKLRNQAETAVLKEFGGRIKIYELQGELSFTSVEVVIRDIVAALETTDFIIIDLKRVVALDEAGYKLLLSLAHRMRERAISLIFSHIRNHGRFFSCGHENQKDNGRQTSLRVFEDNDFAVEWCENQLIARKMSAHAPTDIVSLAAHEMCRGLTKRELTHLQKYLRPMTFRAGESIIKSGDAPDNLYLLVKGEVSVTVSALNGQLKRLSTLSAGMVFGEMAVINRLPRSADVQADSEVHCYALSSEDFDRFSQSDAVLKATLLENLLGHVSKLLRRQNQEISVLAQ